MPRPAAREARQARFRHIRGFGYPFRASCPSTASFPGALGCRNTGFQPRRAASTRGQHFRYGQISPILFSDPCSCRGEGWRARNRTSTGRGRVASHSDEGDEGAASPARAMSQATSTRPQGQAKHNARIRGSGGIPTFGHPPGRG